MYQKELNKEVIEQKETWVIFLWEGASAKKSGTLL